MAKRTIIFRADGSPSFGMGHFTRTLALAEMLNEHFHCVFATRQPTDYQIAEIEKICHGLIDLPIDDSHYDRFIERLKGDEIVVLDNYFFTTNYQRAIKAIGCKLVCIDDIHDKHYIADIVINHAPISRETFSIAPYTILLTGFEYALLRLDFLNEKPKKTDSNSMKHAFLCIGGSDFTNLTLKIFNDIAKIDFISTISIVVGNGYIHQDTLFDAFKPFVNEKTINFYQSVDSKRMVEIMRSADFGIVPCSSVLFEAISQNLPVITGYYVENQKDISDNLINKHPQIKVIGDLTNRVIKYQDVIELREGKEKFLNKLIGENIKDNFIREFELLSLEFMVNIRKAKIEDFEIYFRWANDSDVRANAINPDQITLENHINWFKSKIISKYSYLYLIEINNSPIGQIRFDYSDKYYVIDYSVDRNHRGKGFGRLIIKIGIEKLLEELSTDQNLKLLALVKEDNIASSKVFEKLNFSNKGVIKIEDFNYLKYIKTIDRFLY